MIGHEQKYNKVANTTWFVLGLVLMVYWLVYDLGTMGSIMFGLVYFPFVVFNLVMLGSPLNV